MDQGKYEPTQEMGDFLVKTVSEFVRTIDRSVERTPTELADYIFEHVCEEMFKSEDREIKIELPQCMMMIGFVDIMRVLDDELKEGHFERVSDS